LESIFKYNTPTDFDARYCKLQAASQIFLSRRRICSSLLNGADPDTMNRAVIQINKNSETVNVVILDGVNVALKLITVHAYLWTRGSVDN
jgi:hypothetical protein